ncbi:putative amino-acid metabolite efflux pump [Oceanibacterium hippocampi]|uniref:Putative amino-acid metabolite efflux pump n=1 Tax=Oceanibacterium hippocampi TaxID=745714 RepID=A0A1Y5RZT5_9PROT|nr:DMT family transporter [Oceanibacterium hippocampi]SLN26385.1 putative amino-acid metabolite efflux pump [Oceanibacterium hippocampi]
MNAGEKESGALQGLWLAAMPGVFVLLWSTGFIGAKLGLPYAEPLTFLSYRFAIVGVTLVVFSLLTGASWPRRGIDWLHIAFVGLMMHGIYLGGVFSSIHLGVPAGVSALIVGIQPLLVAAAAGPVLRERVTARQWAGLVLGLGGVMLVVEQKLAVGEGTPFAVSLSIFALVGITVGTLYQKRFCSHMNLRTGNAIQFTAAGAAVWLISLLTETGEVVWSGEFVFALGWLVVVLSFGAMTLLYILIRRGAAARVSSLFFLVPPSTAVIAFFLFGEQLGWIALFGMALTMVGVAMVNLRPAKPAVRA